MSRLVLGWWFAAGDTLPNGDGRKVVVGETLTVDPPIKLCERGLHASRRLIDALKHAPGEILCRVRLSGDIVRSDDKMVATRRTALWRLDATRALRLFACDVAESALNSERAAGREPAQASWSAVHMARRWVNGEVTDAELNAAWSAAEIAAQSAAESVAESAARSAAESAARSAAESAARSAAESAAWSAAEIAAESAARSAAWSVAWSAAEIAARSAARNAAEIAAESAARNAAEIAAESAARSAAWSAVWSAAEIAAESAARNAAWSAAERAAESAAESAARSVAWSAAWSAAEKMLQRRVRKAHALEERARA